MRWNFSPFRKRKLLDASQRFRREHEVWLTHALARLRRSPRSVPRIPTRAVRNGGFDALRTRDHGPERAKAWWLLAMERVAQK